MKNINLTKELFIEKLKKYFQDNEFNTELKEIPKSVSHWLYDITIAGHKSFKYAIYDTPKGLSVVPQGQNQELANEILMIITSDVSEVIPKKQEFVGIITDTYEQIKKTYASKEDYTIEEVNCNLTQINLSISKNKQKVIIQYYPTTYRAILTGQSTYLWDEVFIELTSNLNIEAREIVSLYIKSKEEMQSLQVTYDEGILEEYIKCQLTEEVYLNENLISEIERKWLKTSAFLVFTEIQLPEYFASVASAIKIIEGVLNRICMEYSMPASNNFDYFEANVQSTAWNLKDEFKSNFKNNQKIIQTVNDLYNFIHNNRHKLFHNDGIMPEQVSDKNKAIAIFQQIITLLIQVHKNKVI
ncbi:MAG: hypothetical protein V8R70_08800 [Candidatus Gastranaerophilaceae bacterium]